MSGVSVRNVNKFYGSFQALKDITFEIPQGEFVTLLGPSGCGKTTLLRTIAGFLDCDSGEVYFGDTCVNDIPPNKRDTAMCFQSYALFPNKTVYENICFGLRMRKVASEEQKDRVEQAMEIVNLTGLGNRKPYELSGGQQQRVALARCIVVRPKLLLFDEPLSNLDAKLREKVRVEIRNIQKELGITAIYVTHDQAEALAISDRIIVMNEGRIVQNATPHEVYDTPNSRYVADFIGTANIVACEAVKRENERILLHSCFGDLWALDKDSSLQPKDKGLICIRPEDVIPVTGERPNENCFEAVVKTAVYMGNMLDLFAEAQDTQLRAGVAKNHMVREGEKVLFHVAPDRIRVLEV